MWSALWRDKETIPTGTVGLPRPRSTRCVSGASGWAWCHRAGRTPRTSCSGPRTVSPWCGAARAGALRTAASEEVKGRPCARNARWRREAILWN